MGNPITLITTIYVIEFEFLFCTGLVLQLFSNFLANIVHLVMLTTLLSEIH